MTVPIQGISVLVAGDVCPNGRYEATVGGSGAANVFGAGLRDVVERADLVIGNLECPLTSVDCSPVKVGPALAAKPECARGLGELGFNVLGLANNHIMDRGPDGLAETIVLCRDAGMRVVGAGSSLADALEPARVELGAFACSIIAVAEREFSLATEHSPGACPVDSEAVYLTLRREADSADAVIVLLHGGNEYYSLPGPHLVSRCRFLVDAGASAVVCSHSHVPSGVEMYGNAPIAYGLGNFMFACTASPPVGWTQGLVAQLTFSPGGKAGLRLLPVRQNTETGCIDLADGAVWNKALTAAARCSETIADPALLACEWDRFCVSRRVEYLSRMLCLTRGERALLRGGVWPRWRASRRQVLNLLNTLECESHREAARQVLRAELSRKE